MISLDSGFHPQGVGHGSKAAKAATTMHRRNDKYGLVQGFLKGTIIGMNPGSQMMADLNPAFCGSA
jgi:hypothetical protein